MKRHILIVVVVVCVAGMAGLWAWLSSRKGAPQPAVQSTMSHGDSGQAPYLGAVYKSEVEGFRVAPPAGSRIVGRSGMDLMSFVVDRKSWGGAVQGIRITEKMSLEDFVKTTEAEVTSGKVFASGQVLEERYVKKDGFAAVRLVFGLKAELGTTSYVQNHTMNSTVPAAGTPAERAPDIAVGLLRQELVVRTKDNEFMVLIMYTPLADREAATKTFELMLPEFEIFDGRVLMAHREEAINAGRRWLAKQSAEDFAGKLLHGPQFFRILISGRDAGYLRFDEGVSEPDATGKMAAVERDRHKGVVFHVNMRCFPDDGSIVYGQNEAFWAFSKGPDGTRLADYGCWDNISKTRSRVPDPTRGQLVMKEITPWIEETGALLQINQPHQVVVTFGGDRSQRLPPGIDQIIPAEAGAPLPKVLEYAWPRFVDLATPSEMTFVVYDSASQKIANRNLIVTGRRESVKIGEGVVNCWKCLDEVDPGSSTLWVDDAGRIKMMRTGDQWVMQATTEAELEGKWKLRLNAQ